MVHLLPSSQFFAGPPTHVPPLQASPVVQAFPSLQGSVVRGCVQPVAGLQPSVVQTLPSSQFGAAPPTHVPPLQASPVVQGLPSLQGLVLLVCVQPVAGLQPSVVQTLPSSQLGAAPPTHVPPLQVSPVVQAFPSLQAFPSRFVKEHRPLRTWLGSDRFGSQKLSVHTVSAAQACTVLVKAVSACGTSDSSMSCVCAFSAV